MKDTTVAGRYARALFIVTEKRAETQRALDDLKSLWEVVRPGTRVAEFLATPRVLLSDKRRVLRERLDGPCLRSVVLFLDLLLRKKRLREFGAIVVEFEALVERAQGVKRAHAVSAVPMTDAEQSRLLDQLQSATGAKIKLTTEVDASLLGGALVRIGDRVIDRSVRTLLEAIEQQLAEVSV